VRLILFVSAEGIEALAEKLYIKDDNYIYHKTLLPPDVLLSN
jgi:hypothetical protein